MIESPLIQEIVARTKHESIIQFLEARFGSVPLDVAIQLRTILDEQKLNNLNRMAARCPDIEAFRVQLQS